MQTFFRILSIRSEQFRTTKFILSFETKDSPIYLRV